MVMMVRTIQCKNEASLIYPVSLTCSGYIDVPKYRYSVMHLIVSKSF